MKQDCLCAIGRGNDLLWYFDLNHVKILIWVRALHLSIASLSSGIVYEMAKSPFVI